MPYRYELFLSYPRRPMVVGWLDKFFEPSFREWLHEELLVRGYVFPDRELRIFRDSRKIGAGEKWPNALREAARDSRCALAVLLPSYRESAYCRAEWETFRIRGMELKRSLLVPVRFHDCLDMAITEQVFDLSAYTAMAVDTPKWVEFHDQIKALAAQTAELVVRAPEYPDDPDRAPWLTIDIPEPPPTPLIPRGRL